jgi:hypothetical protein
MGCGDIRQEHGLVLLVDMVEERAGEARLRQSWLRVTVQPHHWPLPVGFGCQPQFGLLNQEYAACLRVGIFHCALQQRFHDLRPAEVAGERLAGLD